jgi:predicted RNA-binding protein with RPS1 domain
VKCIGVDDKGRVRLSRKAALAERDREMKDGKNIEDDIETEKFE